MKRKGAAERAAVYRKSPAAKEEFTGMANGSGQAGTPSVGLESVRSVADPRQEPSSVMQELPFNRRAADG